MESNIEFIKNAGGSITSKNVLEKNGRIKWLFREEPIDAIDNGWRVLSDIDDDEYINNPKNMVVCNFNTLINIEPALMGIYLLPIGSDIRIVEEDSKIMFYDNITEEIIEPKYE